MAQNFLTCDREQSFLLPPDVRDWLPEDHLAWFVVDAVGVMDLAGFYAGYREDGLGRAAYEPSMMVALILYCWSRGMRSSRRIERACLEDVACRVIAANQRPDHATIARFIERHQGALADLFGEVLVLCADAGLATVGVVAIDGTKDAAEDAEFGDRRGDELPEAVATRQGREGWLRDARQRLERERAERGEAIPRSRGKRLAKAKAQLEEELAVEQQANRAYEAYRTRGVDKTGRRFGAPPKPHVRREKPGGKVNLSDPDSKLVHGMRGWVQGYNAQAVCNERHLILAAEVMTASPDFGHLEPMLNAARAELAGAGVNHRPEVVVADAGYWHLEQMNSITGKGVPVLIPPDSTRRKDARPGWTGGAYAFMRSVLAGERGKAFYKQRAQLVEPVFGDTKHNRGFTRFARRGRAAVRTEWRLIATSRQPSEPRRHAEGAAEDQRSPTSPRRGVRLCDSLTRKQSSPSDSATRANGGYAGYGTLCARVKRRMAV